MSWHRFDEERCSLGTGAERTSMIERNLIIMSVTTPIHARRLGRGDLELAPRLFALMAQVFGEDQEDLRKGYVEGLLSDSRFWAIAALAGEELVGGITAHALPLTRKVGLALFVYDVAVQTDHQRRGVGRTLMNRLQMEAASEGIQEIFVLANKEDTHALDFYRAVGGSASAVTMFDFAGSHAWCPRE